MIMLEYYKKGDAQLYTAEFETQEQVDGFVEKENSEVDEVFDCYTKKDWQ